MPYGLWINPKENDYKSTAKLDASTTAQQLRVGQTFHFTNPKEYALTVEYDGHSYHKAPSGMRNLSTAEWQQIVNIETSRARRAR